MVKNITKILEIIDKCSVNGEEIKDRHISALLLCSLPLSYDTLKTSLKARGEDELKFTFIKSKLTDEFNRIHEHLGPTENTAKTFKTHKRFPNKGYKKEEKYCSYCLKINHSNKECWCTRNKTNNAHNKNYKKKK